MGAYYNDNDHKACSWLRELIRAGAIPPGDVDDRPIQEVSPSDLSGYTQCHFFAGIGGWAYAMRLAGWPDDRRVWTGSCPCQPFSVSGKRKGENDERHLWPAFRVIISKCKPAAIFGEQVASNIGREWLAGVRLDLEGMGYAVGAADLCAASVGAPQIRQRLYWVANTDGGKSGDGRIQLCREHGQQQEDGIAPFGVANSNRKRCEGRNREVVRERTTEFSIGEDCTHDGMRNPNEWGNDWIECSDGKARRVEPGICPLAHGVSGRVGLLRGYGNAIVPQVAAAFIKSFLKIGG